MYDKDGKRLDDIQLKSDSTLSTRRSHCQGSSSICCPYLMVFANERRGQQTGDRIYRIKAAKPAANHPTANS